MLIHRLGDTTYGIWIVLGSLTGYFGLLELGIRGSVGRHIALHFARNDQTRVNGTLNTALTILGAIGIAAMLGTCACLLFFFRVFDVAPEMVGEVQIALLLVGLNLGLALVLNAFDATLWGLQRFDLLNVIDIPTTLARVGLTWVFVRQDGGLIALALITVVLTVLNGLTKAALSFRVDRALRLGATYVTAEAAKELFTYGIWNCLTNLVRLGRTNLSPILIGAILGMGFVTPFAIANRLLTLSASIMAAVTGILTPVATTYHARNDNERQRRLFILGTRYSFALAIPILTLLAILGGPLITIWVGPALAHASVLLTILCAGELLPSSQYISTGLILATARNRKLAVLGLIEGVSVGATIPIGAFLWGLPGVCVAVAIPAAACRGVAQIIFGCREAGVPLLAYVVGALLVPLACGIPAVVALMVVVVCHSPVGIVELTAYAAGYCLCYVLGCSVFVWRDFAKKGDSTETLRRIHLQEPAAADV
jgi:O-antigen/teichoic acid export membrane protein